MNRELSPALRTLMAKFGQELPEKLAEIRKLHDATNGSDAEALQEYYTAVHRIAGSSGSYGYKDVSLVARELDRYLSDVIAGEKSYTEEEAADWLAKIDDAVVKSTQAG